MSGVDERYRKRFGVSRTELNNLFIGRLNRSIKILEVGSNIGNQLLLLQKMEFKNLYGIEINRYPIEISKSRAKNVKIIQGSALNIPFKDNYFDLVFTSGLLIHIAPSDINVVLKEIYISTKKYIWGFEYYASKYTEVLYRGHKNLLWKTDFAKLYLDLFGDLKLIKEKRLKHLNDESIDTMFLIKKLNG